MVNANLSFVSFPIAILKNVGTIKGEFWKLLLVLLIAEAKKYALPNLFVTELKKIDASSNCKTGELFLKTRGTVIKTRKQFRKTDKQFRKT